MPQIFKKILESLNPLTPCKKWGVPIWQCPQFLFLLMGLIIIGAILATYSIATYRIGDPKIVALVVLTVAFILLILDFIITRSFERIAEASRMKTEFISVVSHQLRSPLTNLKYSLELLISGKLGKIQGKKLEYFKILEENTQRMGDLINDLLTVSRIETGRLPLKKEEISLGALTKKVILKFKPLADTSNVKVELRAPKNLPKVLSDPLWLEQIVENLLDNAIRYIKNKGEVKIRIKAGAKKIYFEIQDNGVGIPKEEQKFIFQKFFRSENVLKYQTDGSGLGLYIAKQILKLLGGEIDFSSKENKGSTFWFTLPIKS
ncbi:HAMP domain-containing histidine kinase [Patescibacteria group bacterium]|nr:HAMP domain-containing histidine kinase [Patescibacteria group bacterium]